MGAIRHAARMAPIVVLLAAGCSQRSQEVEAVKASVVRYNDLLRDGYQRQNMSWMREVASDEQAQKLYSHMAALGEGNLRLTSALKELQFVRVEFPAEGEATVETRETWDFTHHRIATGEKYAEERGFIYRMSYTLRRKQQRWIIERVDVISGEATTTTIPWPTMDRSGDGQRPGPASAAPPH